MSKITRPTNMATALVNAIVKQDPKQKNWISRTVADRALHTNVGNVVERDNFHLSHKTAVQLGFTK